MPVTVFGCGYVGLVTGVCLAKLGHRVQCIDIDKSKIDTLSEGQIPFFEPKLKPLLDGTQSDGKISFSTYATLKAEICIIAVGTPLMADGSADLAQVYAAADAISEMAHPPKVVVLKSTAPPGTTRKLGQYIRRKRPDWTFDIVSNPEFLRQGNAVSDFQFPDRIVIGAEDFSAFQTVKNLYGGLALPPEKFVKTGIESAELTKYAANAFLATKIAFINELAGFCENVKADVGEVAAGMGLDSRVGPAFLQPGPGIGGSCFPKDLQALSTEAQKDGKPLKIVDAVIHANHLHLEAMASKVRDLCGGGLDGLKITVFGVTFKANTDDLRSSPALTIIPTLQNAGAKVTVVDPKGQKKAQGVLKAVTWEDDPYQAAIGSDAIVILTEWEIFRTLDLAKLSSLTKTARLADLRNLYERKTAEEAGFKYTSVGR